MSERAHEAAHEAEPAASPARGADYAGPVQTVLSLQRTAGNRAVSRLIANGRYLARDKARDDRLKTYRDAVKTGNWAEAARRVNGFDDSDMAMLLKELTPDQRRWMRDALNRPHGGNPARVGPVLDQLMQTADFNTESLGGGYGILKTEGEPKIKNGDKGKGEKYRYEITMTFEPHRGEDTKPKAPSTEISWIQTVRLTKRSDGTTADWDPESVRRQTGDLWAVDRRPGLNLGWYGYDEPGATKLVRPWKPDKPFEEARMEDNPQQSIPDTKWEFETAVVSKTGPDAGTVYAVMTWGFEVDNDLKITGLPRKRSHKPSPSFVEAVKKWNSQALGPEADRNAKGQQSLPGLL